MSDSITRDYSLTVRLSPDERATLEALATRFDLDKSATVRHVLHLASSDNPVLPSEGRFVPLRHTDVTFPVRLSGKDAHDR